MNSRTSRDRRSIRRLFSDRRNALLKLIGIIDYLRELGYIEGNPIPHDDVVYAIEKTRGTDSRTIKKYLDLLVRHDYLKPVRKSRKIRNDMVYAKRFVSIKTKSGTFSREYKTEIGFKFYVFGPRVTSNIQKKLVPPATPLPRSYEGSSQKNMCVSDRFGDCSRNGGKGTVLVVPESTSKIEIEKKEEEVVLHTHISRNTEESEITTEEKRILKATKEGASNG